jgi:hypothetical protein
VLENAVILKVAIEKAKQIQAIYLKPEHVELLNSVNRLYMDALYESRVLRSAKYYKDLLKSVLLLNEKAMKLLSGVYINEAEKQYFDIVVGINNFNEEKCLLALDTMQNITCDLSFYLKLEADAVYEHLFIIQEEYSRIINTIKEFEEISIHLQNLVIRNAYNKLSDKLKSLSSLREDFSKLNLNCFDDFKTIYLLNGIKINNYSQTVLNKVVKYKVLNPFDKAKNLILEASSFVTNSITVDSVVFLLMKIEDSKNELIYLGENCRPSEEFYELNLMIDSIVSNVPEFNSYGYNERVLHN